MNPVAGKRQTRPKGKAKEYPAAPGEEKVGQL